MCLEFKTILLTDPRGALFLPNAANRHRNNPKVWLLRALLGEDFFGDMLCKQAAPVIYAKLLSCLIYGTFGFARDTHLYLHARSLYGVNMRARSLSLSYTELITAAPSVCVRALL
jgi:hypothetical protein